MHRFHISPGSIIEGSVILDKKEGHHALSVLRVEAGEVVELLDGRGGVYQGIVASTEKGRVKVSVREKSSRHPQNGPQITLAVSVIKPERMEYLIEKSCELGVHAVLPLITERTVVRLSPERWRGKIQRWQKIAQESCKQCGQSRTPEIQNVEKFDKVIRTFLAYDLCLIPTLAVPVKPLYQTLSTYPKARSIMILIGPEGDFSKNEAQMALSAGAQAVTLGSLVMRSETAVVFSLSVVNFFYRECAKTD